MFWVYVIQSLKTGRFYIGSTNNLVRRLEEHNRGKFSTKSGVPWKLVYKEKFKTRSEACKRELRIKSYKGGNAFKRLLN